MVLRLIYTAIALLLAIAPASAQLRIGVKGGIGVNHLSFDKNVISSENQCGFTGGLQLEFSLPVTGLGLEGSLMYSHRKDALSTADRSYSRDYIEIPVHLKYGLTILGLNRFLVPYALTGPNFSFLFNEGEQDMWDNRASNTSWDVGFGVELFNHLQVQAAYCIGLTKTFKQVGLDKADLNKVGIDTNGGEVNGRDRVWSLTATYLF